MKKFNKNLDEEDILPKKNVKHKRNKKFDRALKTKDIDFLINFDEDELDY